MLRRFRCRFSPHDAADAAFADARYAIAAMPYDIFAAFLPYAFLERDACRIYAACHMPLPMLTPPC